MLAGKTALITGSTSGIGLGIAELLAKASANVALNGMGDAAHIEAIRARIAANHDVLLAAQPTKKFVTIEHVAAQAGVLASDAAVSITGAVIPLEGSLSAALPAPPERHRANAHGFTGSTRNGC